MPIPISWVKPPKQPPKPPSAHRVQNPEATPVTSRHEPPAMNSVSLKDQLRAERESAYVRLRGGFPIPLAGAVWWAALGIAGYLVPSTGKWIFGAFVSSGLIFPLALLFARIFRIDFMRDRTAHGDVILPAFISMLIFWPIAISAWWNYSQLVPLVLAIGMSIHWPAIGWSYNRTALYSAHAIARAVVCFAIWNWMPQHRFTVLPLAVSGIYVATVIAILVDTRQRTATQRPKALATDTRRAV